MNKAFTIGIAGGSASGKSTFTGILENELAEYNVFTIHMDSYFKPKNERPYSEAPITKFMYTDDNHPLTVDLPKLADDFTKAIDSNSHDIIIVEGLLTLWDRNIYSKLDLKLFIDCKPDERIVRRLRRNMQKGLSFDEISSVYLDLVRYRHDEYVEPSKWRADLVLNGSSMSTQATDVIVSFIKGKITK